MRLALVCALALPSALVALVASSACGGGASTSDPLNQREPAPSGTDSPPSMYESPPSTYEQPPSSTDTPPTMGDPANQSGVHATGTGSCLACSGTYSCTSSSGSDTITLGMQQGVCMTTVDDVSFNVPACGESMSSSSITVTLGAGGSFMACVDGDGGIFSGCATCTPASSGGGEDGGSVVITGGSGACGTLSACCSKLNALDAPSCTETVSVGNAEACSTALMGFEEVGLCS
jgi:hypothetical protein